MGSRSVTVQAGERGGVQIVTGISHVGQSASDMERFAALVAPLEGHELGAVHLVTTLTGSAVLAMALHNGWLEKQKLWQLAHIDEDFQVEKWGADEEAQQNRQRRHEIYSAATMVFEPEN